MNVDIKTKVTKSNMQSLYLMATQKLPVIVKGLEARVRLTFYSLYKQINEGDADEVPGTEELTDPIKL